MIADLMAAASQGYVAAAAITGTALSAVVIYLERQAIWRAKDLRRNMAHLARPQS